MAHMHVTSEAGEKKKSETVMFYARAHRYIKSSVGERVCVSLHDVESLKGKTTHRNYTFLNSSGRHKVQKDSLIGNWQLL